MKIKYKTLKEAQKQADLENMGRDYSTAIVVKECDYYLIKIV